MAIYDSKTVKVRIGGVEYDGVVDVAAPDSDQNARGAIRPVSSRITGSVELDAEGASTLRDLLWTMRNFARLQRLRPPLRVLAAWRQR